MRPKTMPEPAGPEDERFVWVVTAAGVEALRERAAFDSEREISEQRLDAAPVSAHDRRLLRVLSPGDGEA